MSGCTVGERDGGSLSVIVVGGCLGSLELVCPACRHMDAAAGYTVVAACLGVVPGQAGRRRSLLSGTLAVLLCCRKVVCSNRLLYHTVLVAPTG